MLTAFLWVLFGYLCGSIPFSFIIARLKGIDITQVGSGNVGGTNVLRSAGAFYGILSMILDVLKAFIPTFLALNFSGEIAYFVAFFTVIGHIYPIWLKFKGGKGVASTVGTYFALNPTLALIFYLIWLPLVLTTKYVSLASISTLSIIGFISFIYSPKLGLLNVLLALISIYKHRSNINRLLNKTERKTDIIEIFKNSIKK
ncbi:acyl-phosphate glycerol-3-phosphate acyltransferase [Marinitoga hydrogenitolerans DSM 16785]|uniref:Glycerol-3-phosphate acyltransferase n=1 Tax=Marinitoga hydrogenitolerans (strain DSM 16785 / JCM 12826 / AT1271) TaxID=1122195 RepID=A0A1M4ZZ69_MARH1|nr:glycerol-3-phosphate 1-O-acyltransferase PlsY [Marinitoga hydrogenitolerans]SHF23353.1 acyl-phosphate glycerol-3-phosphate acyltransferase [Marinitoga hydrogenitolerans DSM 16785]